MRPHFLRFSLAVLALSLVSLPASAAVDAGCPSNIVISGTIACHTNDTDCRACDYSCDNGTNPTWNMCGET